MVEYKNFLEKLKPLVAEIKKEQTLRLENGELFNIFPILRKPHDEEYLHSAFLAELLSPTGSHGQGSVFLALFIETCCPEYEDINAQKAKVAVEYSAGRINKEMTEGGKVDLLIDSGQGAIVIENKIYASDQPNQLLRYARFADNKYISHKLLYLTLDHAQPTDWSLGGKVFPYKCISYPSQILPWLTKCIEHSKNKPMIKAVIQQYSDLLKTLTRQSTEETMNTDILKLIKSDKDYGNCVVELIKVVNSLENDITIRFAQRLTTNIVELVALSNEKKLKVHQVEDGDGLCICFDLVNELGDKIASPHDRTFYSDIFRALFPEKINSNNAYIAWYNPERFGNGQGFKNLSLDQKIELYMDEDKIDELVDTITKEKSDIIYAFMNEVNKQ